MSTGKEIVKALEDFKREMMAGLRSVKDSLKVCSGTWDETKVISSDIKALRKEFSDLVSCNEHLRAENKRLTQRIEELAVAMKICELETKA